MSDIVTRKPVKAKAIFFDGTNAKAVVEFARENGATEARNGGRYVKVMNNVPSSAKLTKDSWLVFDADGRFVRYNVEEFSRLFRKFPATRGEK